MNLKDKLVIAISSRALFDLAEEHNLYTKSKEDYTNYQIKNKKQIHEKGHAFNLIEKLLLLNTLKTKQNKTEQNIEIVVISRNSVQTGTRIINSINHYGLNIDRFVFTGGESPTAYLANEDLNISLFLTHDKVDTSSATQAGIPAATILSYNNSTSKKIKFAFDGDAVLFSHESELIYQKEGLEAFTQHEIEKTDIPLAPGALKNLFIHLNNLSTKYPNTIEIGLFTARSRAATMRVLNTFESWGVYPNHGCFLGGVVKRGFLKSFNADIFFDDHHGHCEAAREHVSTAHVPSIARK